MLVARVDDGCAGGVRLSSIICLFLKELVLKNWLVLVAGTIHVHVVASAQIKILTENYSNCQN